MLGSGARERLPELDIVPHAGTLPVVVSRVEPAICAVLLLVVGVGLFALGVVLLLPLNRVSVSVSPWLLSTGTLLARSSIRQFRWSGAWHFSRDYVERRRLRPFGLDAWREPLSAYTGVVAQQQPRRNHPLGRPYPVYTLVLEHGTCPDRNVLLYSCVSHAALRGRQKRYGRLFGKPLLTRGRSTVRERPDRGGLSVREQVADGLLDAQFDPTTRPRGAMRLAVRNHALSLVAPRGRCRRMAAAVLCTAGLACWCFVALGRLAPDLKSPATDWPWAVGAWAVTLLLLVVWWFREELSVSPYRISRLWCIGICIVKTQSVQAWTVQDVYVGEPVTDPSGTSVCIESASGDLAFGRTLNAAEKEWVHRCVLKVITAPLGPQLLDLASSHARAAGWAA
jgi:hypothetical protein